MIRSPRRIVMLGLLVALAGVVFPGVTHADAG